MRTKPQHRGTFATDRASCSEDVLSGLIDLYRLSVLRMIDREKMICSILLLITLTSCVSGSFVVNVTQSSYQAEENHDITLEWTFSPRTDGSTNSLIILCEMLTDLRPFVLFHLYQGVEVPESQDERFSGRVQFDKDVLREGRLRLHMSRLRTNDSGVYVCQLSTGYGWVSRKCRLSVTAARDRPKPETPNTTRGGRDASPTGSPSEPESWGWMAVYCVIGVLVVVDLLGVYRSFLHSLRGEEHLENHSPSIEQDPKDSLHIDTDDSSLSSVYWSKAASDVLVVMI